jgi:hypothetical protein
LIGESLIKSQNIKEKISSFLWNIHIYQWFISVEYQEELK